MTRSHLALMAADPTSLTGQEMTPALLAKIAGLSVDTAYARLRHASRLGYAQRPAFGRYIITTKWLPALRSLVAPLHQGQPAET